MKHFWILFVAIGLLIAGSLSLMPRSDSSTSQIEPMSPVVHSLAPQQASLGLSLAGLPNLMPSEKPHGVHALPTAEEAADANRELSNRSYIDGAGLLLKADTKDFVRKNEHARMRAVVFLANSAHWTSNPEREAVLMTVTESIEQANATTPTDMRQRKSIAGDKVELFEILLREAPDRAADMEQRNQGTWLQPILHHAHARFDRFSNLSASR